MRSTEARQSPAAVVGACALALLAGACSHSRQSTARSPMQPNEEQGITNPQPTQARVPNTPTAANVSISAEILRACNIPDADAYFAFDSARLTAFDRSPLDRLATCFRSGPLQGRPIRLVGHADPRGGMEYNMTLGQSRADAVLRYLKGLGVSSTQLSATSRGALDATGRDETGWAHDRRVDVELGP